MIDKKNLQLFNKLIFLGDEIKLVKNIKSIRVVFVHFVHISQYMIYFTND